MLWLQSTTHFTNVEIWILHQPKLADIVVARSFFSESNIWSPNCSVTSKDNATSLGTKSFIVYSLGTHHFPRIHWFIFLTILTPSMDRVVRSLSSVSITQDRPGGRLLNVLMNEATLFWGNANNCNERCYTQTIRLLYLITSAKVNLLSVPKHRIVSKPKLRNWTFKKCHF